MVSMMTRRGLRGLIANIVPSANQRLLREKIQGLSQGFKLLFKNETECSYCEIHKKCRYFPDMEEIPSNTDIIEMWLKEEE